MSVPLRQSCFSRRRIAGAVLAAAVAIVAVAGAWHEHPLVLEVFHLCAPTTAAPPGHDHDCLACKITPPFATPWNASTLIDPGPKARQALLPQEAQSPATALVEPAAPRGPPAPPQA